MLSTDFETYEAKCRRLAQLNDQIRPFNKAVLFEALSAAGVAVVTIDFDGCGDSGQFDAMLGFSADDEPREIPIEAMTIQAVDRETETIVEAATTPADYIESLASDLLEQEHEGWEDGDGAYGEFRFELADRSVTLEYNERYTATNYHHHEF